MQIYNCVHETVYISKANPRLTYITNDIMQMVLQIPNNRQLTS